jgi:hypothetical protein
LETILGDEVLAAYEYDAEGFREIRGYDNDADPWKEECYSDLAG